MCVVCCSLRVVCGVLALLVFFCSCWWFVVCCRSFLMFVLCCFVMLLFGGFVCVRRFDVCCLPFDV